MRAALLVAVLGACRSATSPLDVPLSSSMLVGVATHGEPPAGVDIVRRDEDMLSWVDSALARGAQPLVIVGYWSPTDDFGPRCARAAAAGAWIEFWNEPNLPEFWSYNAETGQSRPRRAPSAEQWVTLLAECRSAAPNAVIMGPALGGSDWDWAYLERATRAGMMNYLDVVTFHGYATSPEELRADTARVRSITGAQRVAVSEWAFRSGGSQAENVRRALHAGAAAGLEFVVFYDGRADGNTLSDQSMNVIREWRNAQ